MLLLLHGGEAHGFTLFGYDLPRMHAVINDLPILLVVAVLFEVIYLISKRDGFRLVSFWMLMSGAVGGALAVISGLLAEDHIDHGEAIHEIMEHHETLALWTLGIFGVVALWRIFRERKMTQGERIAALLLAFVGTGFLAATGSEGGEMVFEHAAGTPTDDMQSELKDRAAGHTHGEMEEEDHDHDKAAPAHTDSAAH
ncbi:MAG: DUF2231 domain-containing protein [Gemmatimonadota bacterium]